jgi:hypothetical protein
MESDCTCGTTCVLAKCQRKSACNEALIRWDGPVANTDGTCLVDLTGFNIRWVLVDGGADAGDAGGPFFLDAALPCIPGPTVTCDGSDASAPDAGDAGRATQLKCAHRLGNLVNGTWEFTVSSYNEAGVESTAAGPATKNVACP